MFIRGSLTTSGVIILCIFFGSALVFRLALLALSVKHEKLLKQQGAIEIGAANSRLLAGLHVLFYGACFAEGLYRQPACDGWSKAGLILFVLGASVLVIVIWLLGPLWTVKLLIARDHQLVTHPLFRVVRHPNYYLNLLPELIGYARVFHAFSSLGIVLPFYLIALIRRVHQEERAMKERFQAY